MHAQSHSALPDLRPATNRWRLVNKVATRRVHPCGYISCDELLCRQRYQGQRPSHLESVDDRAATEWTGSDGMLLLISKKVGQVEATQIPMSVTKQQAKRTM